ncbi:hypothetical protein VNO78_32996 [Psophocarpus tetragonolobus]|uniref:Uncharacterized protein n=1 Tax=Psophocarpus tetragonolobus TaxID=3891 RepID=A0AAN9NXK5_PSOTE
MVRRVSGERFREVGRGLRKILRGIFFLRQLDEATHRRERLNVSRFSISPTANHIINYIVRVNIYGQISIIKLVEEVELKYYVESNRKEKDNLFKSSFNNGREDDMDPIFMERSLGQLRQKFGVGWDMENGIKNKSFNENYCKSSDFKFKGGIDVWKLAIITFEAKEYEA